MNSARFAGIVAANDTVVDPQTGGDADYIEQAKAACVKKGFRFRPGSVIVRTPSKHKLARLQLGPARTIIVMLDGIKAADIIDLKAAQRCEVRSALAVRSRDATVRKHRRENLELYRDGCYAVAPTPDDAAALITAIYRRFNR